MTKKYGGVIQKWYKVYLTDIGYTQEALNERYGPNLGFIIRGFLPEDPTNRGFGGYPLQTSLVVKWDCSECSDELMIETLNTRYLLGAKHGES